MMRRLSLVAFWRRAGYEAVEAARQPILWLEGDLIGAEQLQVHAAWKNGTVRQPGTPEPRFAAEATDWAGCWPRVHWNPRRREPRRGLAPLHRPASPGAAPHSA